MYQAARLACRNLPLLVVARFLDSAAIGERCPNDVIRHWISVADRHAGHVDQLQVQIRDFRSLVRRLVAENETMEGAASRLCDLLVAHPCEEDVFDAIRETRAALKGKFSRRKQDWEASVPLFAAAGEGQGPFEEDDDAISSFGTMIVALRICLGCLIWISPPG